MGGLSQLNERSKTQHHGAIPNGYSIMTDSDEETPPSPVGSTHSPQGSPVPFFGETPEDIAQTGAAPEL